MKLAGLACPAIPKRVGGCLRTFDWQRNRGAFSARLMFVEFDCAAAFCAKSWPSIVHRYLHIEAGKPAIKQSKINNKCDHYGKTNGLLLYYY